MTAFQKVIKYLAFGFAICLAVGIIGGALSIFGFFDGVFGGDNVTENITTYEVSADIQSLEVIINAADFVIKQGEVFSVESNLKNLTVEDKNGVLKVKETKKFSGSTYTGAVLTLYIPEGTVFEKANITTGAGRLTVDILSANKMNLELGAGEVNIDNLIADSYIDIDGGAGKITVSDGSLHDLDLDMGVGQLNMTSSLAGECDFDLGIGESNITVIGKRSDYKLDIEKGIGNVTVDGAGVSNVKEQGGGKNSIEVNGGIGAINMRFIEE